MNEIDNIIQILHVVQSIFHNNSEKWDKNKTLNNNPKKKTNEKKIHYIHCIPWYMYMYIHIINRVKARSLS